MKISKILAFFIFAVLMIGFSLAFILDKEDKGSVVISEINNPAVYNFKFFSSSEDGGEIFSFVGLSFSPRGVFYIPEGNSDVEVKVYPSADLRKNTGNYELEYFIKTQNSGLFKDTIKLRIVHLYDAIQFEAGQFYPGDSKLKINVINNENTVLEDVTLTFESAFFKSNKSISLKPYETQVIEIELNKEEVAKLVTGEYKYYVVVGLGQVKTQIEKSVMYAEKSSLDSSEESSGFVIRKHSVMKTNNGNVPVTAKVEIKKEVFGRLFTTFNLAPDSTERNGMGVVYTWEKELRPAESLVVNAETNYTLPLLILVLVLVVAFLTNLYLRTTLVLNKKVSYVKTKGGEFAVKVIVRMKARAHVQNLTVTEHLPLNAKLYEKYGRMPDQIDHGRVLHWKFASLNPGEERVFSYIIYSKLKVIGRFESSPAHASYDSNGKRQHVSSNSAYFVSDVA